MEEDVEDFEVPRSQGGGSGAGSGKGKGRPVSSSDDDEDDEDEDDDDDDDDDDGACVRQKEGVDPPCVYLVPFFLCWESL